MQKENCKEASRTLAPRIYKKKKKKNSKCSKEKQDLYSTVPNKVSLSLSSPQNNRVLIAPNS